MREKHHFTTYERDNGSGLDYAVNRYNCGGLGTQVAYDTRDRARCEYNQIPP
jgi:hypothetical protein